MALWRLLAVVLAAAALGPIGGAGGAGAGAARASVARVEVNGAALIAGGASGAASNVLFTDAPNLRVAWTYACAAADGGRQPRACRGLTQETVRVRLTEIGTQLEQQQHRRQQQGVVYDSGVLPTSRMQHSIPAGRVLRADARYELEVETSVAPPPGGVRGKLHQPRAVRGVLQTTPSFHGVGGPGNWTAAWIAGGTQLRRTFALDQPVAAVATAVAYASGLGCFKLWLNGQPVDNQTFLEPGWNFLPTVRVHYRAYDVTALMRTTSTPAPGATSTAALGARLGMCKFGYQQKFCVGAHASHAVCRALFVQLVVRFQNGQTQVVGTRPGAQAEGGWQVTTAGSPLRYTHLFHGEIYDANAELPGWSLPNFTTNTSTWSDAEPAAFVLEAGAAPRPATQALGALSLLDMPPIAVTETRDAVAIRRVAIPSSGGNCSLGGVVTEGQALTVACQPGTGRIARIDFANYGTNQQGRFVGGTVGGACADPHYPTGCIFFENPANASRHFVKECVTKPCGANACPAFVPVGRDILKLAVGPQFDCPMYQCVNATAGNCSAPSSLSVVEAACVGKATCSVAASSSAFGGDPCPGTPKTLAVRASGCQPATAEAFVFDFGQNLAGTGRLNLDFTGLAAPPPTAGAPRAVVTLKYAERLNPDGTVDMAWCGGEADKCVCDRINCANQTDQYIASPAARQTFTTEFTYHGFRYVQVEGLPEGYTPTTSTLQSLFVHTDLEPTGHVHTANPTLNGIQKAIVYTQLSNIHSHPTDCPTREKRGWTGDSQLTAAQASLNFDTRRLYGTWLQTMEDHNAVGCSPHLETPAWPRANVDICCDPGRQSFGCAYQGVPGGRFGTTGGSVADVVPFSYVGAWPGDPSWGSISAVLPWEVLLRTGDDALVRRFYNLSRASADFFLASGDATADHLAVFGYYGDWLSLRPIDKGQVTATSHIRAVSHVVDMARHLGLQADLAHYKAQLTTLKAAYNRLYFNVTSGLYHGGTQTASILPLSVDLPEPAARPRVVEALVQGLLASGNGTTSGIVGNAFVLQVLAAANRSDLALSMATKTDFPSWGHMVLQGPGTIWEAWAGTTNSLNHPALTATIGKFLYTLAGLDPAAWAAAPGPGSGVVQAVVHPDVARRLGAASARVATLDGIVQLAWECQAALGFAANLTLPLNGRGGVAHLLAPGQSGGGGKGRFCVYESDVVIATCGAGAASCASVEGVLPPTIEARPSLVVPGAVAVHLPGGDYALRTAPCEHQS